MKKMILALLVLLCFIKVDAMAADTTWQEDYEYTLFDADQEIFLQKYIGTEENLTIPAKAIVGDEEYATRVITSDWEDQHNPWQYTSVKSITFEDGVRLNGLGYLFWHCENLEEFVLTNSADISMAGAAKMFDGCSSLKEVDLSTFDFTYVMDSLLMFDGCSSLKQIKTPQNVEVEKAAKLPGIFYDSSYNFYTTLPQTSMTLTKGPVNASSAKVSVSSQVYTGKALKPAPVVKLGSYTIDKSNYSVSYSNNTEPGTANIKVTFSGNFTGSVKSTFQITHTHTPVVLPAKDPTVDETGLTEGKKCSVCGKILVEQNVIPKVIVEAKEKNDVHSLRPGKKAKLKVKVKNAKIIKVKWTIPKKKERKWAKLTKKGKYQARLKMNKAAIGHTVHVKAVITYTLAFPKSQALSFSSKAGKKKLHRVKRMLVFSATKVDIKTITLSPGKATLKRGQTKTIKLRKSPSNATSKIDWFKTNSNVDWKSKSRTSATVKARKKGTVKITVKSKDEIHSTQEMKITVK